MDLLPNKIDIMLQYSETYKIQENMHNFVVLSVKIDLEVNNSLKSKLFILYSCYNL